MRRRIAYIVAALVMAASIGLNVVTIFNAKATEKILVEIGHRSLDLAATATSSLDACAQRLKAAGALEVAMHDVGSQPYANPGNNCYDHSKALQKQLAAAGMESSIFVNGDRTHAWLAVWIETTTGKFVPPKAAASFPYDTLIEVRDRSLGVVCTAPRK